MANHAILKKNITGAPEPGEVFLLQQFINNEQGLAELLGKDERNKIKAECGWYLNDIGRSLYDSESSIKKVLKFITEYNQQNNITSDNFTDFNEFKKSVRASLKNVTSVVKSADIDLTSLLLTNKSKRNVFTLISRLFNAEQGTALSNNDKLAQFLVEFTKVYNQVKGVQIDLGQKIKQDDALKQFKEQKKNETKYAKIKDFFGDELFKFDYEDYMNNRTKFNEVYSLAKIGKMKLSDDGKFEIGLMDIPRLYTNKPSSLKGQLDAYAEVEQESKVFTVNLSHLNNLENSLNSKLITGDEISEKEAGYNNFVQVLLGVVASKRSELVAQNGVNRKMQEEIIMNMYNNTIKTDRNQENGNKTEHVNEEIKPILNGYINLYTNLLDVQNKFINNDKIAEAVGLFNANKDTIINEETEPAFVNMLTSAGELAKNKAELDSLTEQIKTEIQTITNGINDPNFDNENFDVGVLGETIAQTISAVNIAEAQYTDQREGLLAEIDEKIQLAGAVSNTLTKGKLLTVYTKVPALREIVNKVIETKQQVLEYKKEIDAQSLQIINLLAKPEINVDEIKQKINLLETNSFPYISDVASDAKQTEDLIKNQLVTFAQNKLKNVVTDDMLLGMEIVNNAIINISDPYAYHNMVMEKVNNAFNNRVSLGTQVDTEVEYANQMQRKIATLSQSKKINNITEAKLQYALALGNQALRVAKGMSILGAVSDVASENNINDSTNEHYINQAKQCVKQLNEAYQQVDTRLDLMLSDATDNKQDNSAVLNLLLDAVTEKVNEIYANISKLDKDYEQTIVGEGDKASGEPDAPAPEPQHAPTEVVYPIWLQTSDGRYGVTNLNDWAQANPDIAEKVKQIYFMGGEVPSGVLNKFANVKNITLAKNVKAVQAEAFKDMKNLQTVYFQADLQNDGVEHKICNIDDNAFSGSNKNLMVHFMHEQDYITANASDFMNYYYNSTLPVSGDRQVEAEIIDEQNNNDRRINSIEQEAVNLNQSFRLLPSSKTGRFWHWVARNPVPSALAVGAVGLGTYAGITALFAKPALAALVAGFSTVGGSVAVVGLLSVGLGFAVQGLVRLFSKKYNIMFKDAKIERASRRAILNQIKAMNLTNQLEDIKEAQVHYIEEEVQGQRTEASTKAILKSTERVYKKVSKNLNKLINGRIFGADKLGENLQKWHEQREILLTMVNYKNGQRTNQLNKVAELRNHIQNLRTATRDIQEVQIGVDYNLGARVTRKPTSITPSRDYLSLYKEYLDNKKEQRQIDTNDYVEELNDFKNRLQALRNHVNIPPRMSSEPDDSHHR